MFQSKICRVCENSTHLINISLPLNHNYVKQYLACANVSYEANDGLPTYLCRLCVTKLQNAYSFKLKCEETQLKLKILLSKINIKSEHFNLEYSVKSEIHQDNDNTSFDGDTIFDDLTTIYGPTTLNDDSKLMDENSANKNLPQKKNILYCDICKMKFYIMNTLEKHMRNIHGMKENYRTCIKCLKTLKTHRYYVIHKCIPENCSYCGKKYLSKNLLRHINSVHLRMHPYICDICNKSFTQKVLLKTHMMAMHIKDYKYPCSMCNKKFKLKSSVKGHEKKHLPKDKRAIMLPQITKHVRKNIICEICGKGFNSEASLFIHKRVHTGERPFECDICQRRFRINVNLQKHKLTHTDIKPHKCNICNKSFRTLFQLQTHTLVHTGEKPYQCNYCGKSFTQQGSLKAHIRTHTGEKPYKCEHCSKCFSDCSTWIRHKKVHL